MRNQRGPHHRNGGCTFLLPILRYAGSPTCPPPLPRLHHLFDLAQGKLFRDVRKVGSTDLRALTDCIHSVFARWSASGPESARRAGALILHRACPAMEALQSSSHEARPGQPGWTSRVKGARGVDTLSKFPGLRGFGVLPPGRMPSVTWAGISAHASLPLTPRKAAICEEFRCAN